MALSDAWDYAKNKVSSMRRKVDSVDNEFADMRKNLNQAAPGPTPSGSAGASAGATGGQTPGPASARPTPSAAPAEQFGPFTERIRQPRPVMDVSQMSAEGRAASEAARANAMPPPPNMGPPEPNSRMSTPRRLLNEGAAPWAQRDVSVPLPAAKTVGKVLNFAGKSAAVYGAAKDAADVVDVATDPSMSKIDVATDVVSKAGKWGTAGIGAAYGGKVGALGGPFAPVTIPLGAAAGGLIGYFGGEKLIEGGRKLSGVGETSDPSTRSNGAVSKAVSALTSDEAKPSPAAPAQPAGAAAVAGTKAAEATTAPSTATGTAATAAPTPDNGATPATRAALGDFYRKEWQNDPSAANGLQGANSRALDIYNAEQQVRGTGITAARQANGVMEFSDRGPGGAPVGNPTASPSTPAYASGTRAGSGTSTSVVETGTSAGPSIPGAGSSAPTGGGFGVSTIPVNGPVGQRATLADGGMSMGQLRSMMATAQPESGGVERTRVREVDPNQQREVDSYISTLLSKQRMGTLSTVGASALNSMMRSRDERLNPSADNTARIASNESIADAQNRTSMGNTLMNAFTSSQDRAAARQIASADRAAQREVTMRGQDLEYDRSVMQALSTQRTAAARLGFEMSKADDEAVSRGQKDMLDRITAFAGAGKDGKPDAGMAMEMTRGVQNAILASLEEAKQRLAQDPNNKALQQYVGSVGRRGWAALDEQDKGRLLQGVLAKKGTKGDERWWLPTFMGDSNYVEDPRPITYIDPKTGETNIPGMVVGKSLRGGFFSNSNNPYSTLYR